jgi:WD40 repeat protein/tRNA A-37 threonylcarbamoyl transferase component Bud32
MVQESSGSTDHERQINEIISAYLVAVDAGQMPDRQEWLRRYPEFAAELEAFLADYEHVDRMAQPLRPATTPLMHLPPERVASGVAATMDFSQPARLPVGSTIRYLGDYELLEEIARGGMGVIYKARQVSLNRVVAVKMILAGQLATQADRDRFHSEAQAAVVLDHPNIVPVFEVGEYEGQHYFSMGYVDGQSLATRLAEGPLPPEEAAELVTTVAEAVEYAHRQGVIHRDIKPSNVLIDRKGRPRVTDFGLAKQVSNGSELTTTGQVLGTPSYMAPEQAAGQIKSVGPAADVYALGALLYATLTGRPPFQAATPLETLQQVIECEPVALQQLNAAVPHNLETIVLKCLEKSIARRYASAQALVEDLRRYLEGRPILARPVSRWEHAWRWCWRHPALAGLYFVLLLCGLGSTATAIYLNSLLQAKSTAEHLANEKLWESYLAQAQATRLTHQPGQRFRTLKAIRAAIGLKPPDGRSRDELRTEAIAALCLPDLEVDKEWDGYPQGSSAFAIDANFERYARADKDGNVSVRRVHDDRELFALPGIGQCADYGGLLFSPDGRFLRVRRQGANLEALWRIDVSPPAKVVSLDAEGSCFSPDGRRLAFCKVDGTLCILETETGRESCRFAAGLPRASVAWNPADPRQVLLTNGYFYRILNLERGKLGPMVNVPTGSTWPCWHPDGRRIAFSARTDTHIRLWDTQSERFVLPPFQGHQAGGVIFSFSSGGDLLLSSDWTGLWRLWESRTGQQVLSLHSDGHTLQFSLDDQRVAAHTGNGKVRLLRAATGREFGTLIRPGWPQRQGYRDLTKAPLHDQGRLLALTLADGVALVDLERLEELTVLPVPGEGAVAFESSSESLLTIGTSGLRRWHVHFAGDDFRQLEIGSPQLVEQLATGDVSRSNDGTVVAVNVPRGALIWRPKENRQLTTAGKQADVRSCAVSPDAKWVATGSGELLEGAGAKVWDAATGRLAAELPTGRMCCVWFSPDSKWLVTGGEGFRIWEVGTWREGASMRGSEDVGMACAFTRDSKLIALGHQDPGLVRLVDPASGREVARLAAPVPSRLLPKCFTPDGGKLICVGRDNQALHVFDLRLIRSGLRELGLDWDVEESGVTRSGK